MELLKKKRSCYIEEEPYLSNWKEEEQHTKVQYNIQNIRIDTQK